jgi:putative ABC transport system permease protein
MFRHYLLTGWRNLLRGRAYSFINLLGLALGIACCLLMVLYVQDELAYDQHHDRAARIYRVSSQMSMGGNQDHYALTSMAVGPALTAQYPMVDTFVRFMYSTNRRTVQQGDRVFNEQGIFLADPQVFAVFTYPMLAGDPRTALEAPRSVVLTASLAHKYFGETSPLGQRLTIDQQDYQVTGVMADLPANSDFTFQALLSMSTFPEQARGPMMTDWGRVAFYTYLLLDQPESAASLARELPEFVQARIIPFWKENDVSGSMVYHLTALRDLHFRTDTSYDTAKGNESYLYLFSWVALFILLIACFNYINLAVAQGARRSVEVGVRKATGASSRQLLGQFLGESLLLSALAMVVAVLLVEITLPGFNRLADKQFTSGAIFTPERLAMLLGIALLAGLMAGSYPALFLARLQPVKVLKGQLTLSGRHWLRQTLVVLQFSISIALIIGTLVINEQMSYLHQRDLGFRQDQMLVVEVPWDSTVQANLPGIRQELQAHPAVRTVAASRNGLPGQATGALLMRVEQDGQLREDQFNVIWVDDAYLSTLDLQLVAGRAFEQRRSTDAQQAFIVNEAFVRRMGWSEPIGKRMQWGLMADQQAANDGRVVGVVKDYHYTSLHNPIEPLVWLFAPGSLNRLLVSLDGPQVAAGLDHVKAVWQARDPRHPMEYFFLDQFFAQQYDREARLMALFTYFSGLTILIACLGLFGLASYLTRQRSKEVGIRKVLGADQKQLLWLLSQNFASLVLMAFVIASVAAWLLTRAWLTEFAFAISMPWYAYALAGGLALTVAMAATSYHSLQAARANPVDALRRE